MGGFSMGHFLLGGLQFVVVVAVVGVVVYFLLRKPPADTATRASELRSEGGVRNTLVQAPITTALKVISVAYLVGGLFGAVTTLPQLNGASLDFLSALAWLILLAQIAVAIYGGWQFWHQRPVGAQLLYWLSWSCVPVISFSWLSYWCAIGLALFPTMALGLGHFGTDLSLRFGYASELWLNPGNSGFLFGVNAVALLFVSVLTKFMREADIPKWPLVRPNAQ
jgi:hypothetical protein